jgi:hypothetical protein
MQQTSGSSSCCRMDGNDFDVDEVPVVVAFFLLMSFEGTKIPHTTRPTNTVVLVDETIIIKDHT